MWICSLSYKRITLHCSHYFHCFRCFPQRCLCARNDDHPQSDHHHGVDDGCSCHDDHHHDVGGNHPRDVDDSHRAHHDHYALDVGDAHALHNLLASLTTHDEKSYICQS